MKITGYLGFLYNISIVFRCYQGLFYLNFTKKESGKSQWEFARLAQLSQELQSSIVMKTAVSVSLGVSLRISWSITVPEGRR